MGLLDSSSSSITLLSLIATILPLGIASLLNSTLKPLIVLNFLLKPEPQVSSEVVGGWGRASAAL